MSEGGGKFNLVTDDWVPVVMPDGAPRLVGLRDLFKEADRIRDLACNPPQRIALMRLLICIAQAALDGPEDEEDWYNCKARIAPEALVYLDKWHHAFFLRGDQPFMQVPGLKMDKKKEKQQEQENDEQRGASALDKLDMTLATGSSSHTLWDRAALNGARFHPDAVVGLNLITCLSFALGGGKSASVRWGEEAVDGSANLDEKGKPRKNNNALAAPCAAAKLFTIVLGSALLDTIHLNLVSKKAMSAAMPNVEWGQPLWSYYPEGYHSDRARRHRSELLGFLVPMSRLVWLGASGGRTMRRFVNGFDYPDSPATRRDPMLAVYKDAEGALQYVRSEPGRHAWRDLHAILDVRRDCGALTVTNLRLLAGSLDGTVDIWAGGLQNRQGRPVEYAEWVFHLPMSLLQETRLARYAQGVDLGNKAEGLCKDACSDYFERRGAPEFKRDQRGEWKRRDRRSREHREAVWAKVASRLWSALDAQHEILVHTATDPCGHLAETWYHVVRQLMHDAYAYVCPRGTAREIEAFAQGLDCLRLKKPEGE